MARRHPPARSFALASLVAGLAHAQTAPLAVRIDSPSAGLVDSHLTVPFRATVSGVDAGAARLEVNGVAYDVRIDYGSVRQEIVAVPGNNRVLLSVTRSSLTARASSTFYLRMRPVDLVVVATWSAHGERVELYVEEPGTPRDAHLYTLLGDSPWDEERVGFGVQGWSLRTAHPGRYRVEVAAAADLASRDDVPDAAPWGESIDRLDAIDLALASVLPANRAALLSERQGVLSALDAWADPVARRTPVRVDVLLFPNTAHERRWRFDHSLLPMGRSVRVGEFEVTAAMIRAARSVGVAR